MPSDNNNLINDCNPIFVVGMNGSGTTLISDCLGIHPDLYLFPRETRILPHFIKKLDSYGDLLQLHNRRILADDLGNSFPFWRVNKKQPLIIEDIDLQNPGFSGVVDSIFRHFAASKGVSRWIDKSPMYIQHIILLSKYFPGAKFIHIYRDGRDVVQSFHRRWKRYPPLSILRWKKIVKKGRFDGRKIGKERYIEIRYEDFTSNPEKWLKTICLFLDLKYYNQMCYAPWRQIDPKINNGSIVKNSGKWKTYFSDKQILGLERIAGKYLLELGYVDVSMSGSYNPNRIKLYLWKYPDYLKFLINFFKKKGFIPDKFLFKWIKSGLRQNKTNKI